MFQFVEAGVCPCGGELEAMTYEHGWKCKRCGWKVVEKDA